MDGACCGLRGCRSYDFLPFVCPLCDLIFCLEHRSRFNHNCKAVVERRNEAKASGSVRYKFDEVESRFNDDGLNAIGSKIQHFPVSSSSTRSMHSQRTLDKVRQLQKWSSDPIKSLKDRSVAKKTRDMLISTNSIGSSAILPEDRFYIVVKVHETVTDEMFMHYHRSWSLGKVLQSLAKSHSMLLFGDSGIPTGKSLALYSEDSPDWKMWDRDAPISQLLSQCETVYVKVIPTSEAVSAHNALLASAESDMAASSESKEDCAKNDKETEATEVTTAMYKAGDRVWYRNASGGGELVRVVCTHYDDPPEVYYTIALRVPGGAEREKQTDKHHLRPAADEGPWSSNTSSATPSKDHKALGPSAQHIREARAFAYTTTVPPLPTSSPLKGGLGHDAVTGVVIEVKIGAKSVKVPGVNPTQTISQLKTLIASLTGIPAHEQKLIFKGRVLVDQWQISKETPALAQSGAKITLLTSFKY